MSVVTRLNNYQGERDATAPQEDLNFVPPVLRPYIFLRCFTMWDIIMKRPDRLRVGFGDKYTSTGIHTWPPNDKHNPSEVIPGFPGSVFKSLEWVCSRESTEDQQRLAGGTERIEKVEGSVPQIDQKTRDRASGQRKCVERITDYFCRGPGEDHGRVKRVVTRL